MKRWSSAPEFPAGNDTEQEKFPVLPSEIFPDTKTGPADRESEILFIWFIKLPYICHFAL